MSLKVWAVRMDGEFMRSMGSVWVTSDKYAAENMAKRASGDVVLVGGHPTLDDLREVMIAKSQERLAKAPYVETESNGDEFHIATAGSGVLVLVHGDQEWGHWELPELSTETITRLLAEVEAM